MSKPITPESVKKDALKSFKMYLNDNLDLRDLIAVDTFMSMLTSKEKTDIIRGALFKN